MHLINHYPSGYVKTNHAIHWIVIYPVDSVIHILNNPGGQTQIQHFRSAVNCGKRCIAHLEKM